MRGAEYAEIEAFVAVATEGSFVKAAAARTLSTSTLSEAVRSLEQRLGVRLFDRTTRRVALTVAGVELLAQARPALEALRMATASAAALRHHAAGALRLNVSNSLAATMIGPTLARFLDAYPGIAVEISVADDVEEIIGGAYDAGIRHGWRVGLGMAAAPISAPQPMLVAGAPAYLAKRPPPHTPQDLPLHHCIRLRLADGGFFSWRFEKDGVPVEVAVTGPLIVDANELLVQAALDGVGLIYISAEHIAQAIGQGRLTPLLQDWAPPPTSYYLYYSERSKPSTPLRMFIDFLATAR